jgi:hypothetical protein
LALPALVEWVPPRKILRSREGAQTDLFRWETSMFYPARTADTNPKIRAQAPRRSSDSAEVRLRAHQLFGVEASQPEIGDPS